jgi:hypothetical protein
MTDSNLQQEIDDLKELTSSLTLLSILALSIATQSKDITGDQKEMIRKLYDNLTDKPAFANLLSDQGQPYCDALIYLTQQMDFSSDA